MLTNTMSALLSSAMNDALKEREREQHPACSAYTFMYCIWHFFTVPPHAFNVGEKTQHVPGWSQTKHDVITWDPS